jgi:prevent-host-death family protein
MEVSRQLGIKEAREKFSELVMQAETGKTIEIMRHGIPVTKLVPTLGSKVKTKQKNIFAKNLELLELSKPYLRKDGLDTVSYLRHKDEL